ncbi:hypothetical protein [Winogradskyella luteola]|uniref:Uncharacterized protein n=1 Tax=Winogradskyella luteola TaxID=2828330 RepID=A0A9X1FAJ5_9FLAO|nr:hypothetical protein [Winogradskyella luteola]MBV7270316.1 hypothetical protein [Winogradskyella luteola]
MKNNAAMKYLFFFAVLFSIVVSGQDFIKLKTVPFDSGNIKFYIKEIIDDRKEKNLGIHKNLKGETVKLQLFPNAAYAVKSFIDSSLVETSDSQKIYVKINALSIQETRRNTEEVISRATVDLSFCEMRKGKLKELYRIQRNEDQVFAASVFGFTSIIEDVFLSHDQRIRAALEYCFLAFIEHKNSSIDKSSTHFDISNFDENDDNKLNNWYNIIEYRQILTSTYHNGWALGYTGFLDDNSAFIIPYEINIEFYDVKDNFARREGFEYVDATMLRPGIFGYKKIISGVYGTVGVNIPIGVEVKRRLGNDNDIYKFLIGVGASQGMKIIPWQNYGLVLGVEFFQQIQNSEIYTQDIGLEISVGFNF